MFVRHFELPTAQVHSLIELDPLECQLLKHQPYYEINKLLILSSNKMELFLSLSQKTSLQGK